MNYSETEQVKVKYSKLIKTEVNFKISEFRVTYDAEDPMAERRES